MSADSLLQDAKAESGLSDYGAMDFVEGLNVLVKSINADAGLSPDNEVRYRPILLRIMCNRLRMQRDVERHPEILDEEVPPPVFITSLPRTGSTKLHRMLAASGDFNAMTFWQSFNFAPFTDPPATPDPRIAAAKKFLEWTSSKAPLFQEAHPMYADEIEEELYSISKSSVTLPTSPCRANCTVRGLSSRHERFGNGITFSMPASTASTTTPPSCMRRAMWTGS